jgi:hypothetical protein
MVTGKQQNIYATVQLQRMPPTQIMQAADPMLSMYAAGLTCRAWSGRSSDCRLGLADLVAAHTANIMHAGRISYAVHACSGPDLSSLIGSVK